MLRYRQTKSNRKSDRISADTKTAFNATVDSSRSIARCAHRGSGLRMYCSKCCGTDRQNRTESPIGSPQILKPLLMLRSTAVGALLAVLIGVLAYECTAANAAVPTDKIEPKVRSDLRRY